MKLERDESLCKYNSGSCTNKRAERSHGRGPLRVCEIHRRRANAHQKKYQQLNKKKKENKQHHTAVASAAASAQPLLVPTAAATPAPAPLVVFVIANGEDVGASIQLLSAASDLSVGQPFQVVSSGELSDWLRRIERGQAIAATGSQDAATMMAEMELEESKVSSAETHDDELEPLPLELASDEGDALLLDDMLLLSDLLA